MMSQSLSGGCSAAVTGLLNKDDPIFVKSLRAILDACATIVRKASSALGGSVGMRDVQERAEEKAFAACLKVESASPTLVSNSTFCCCWPRQQCRSLSHLSGIKPVVVVQMADSECVAVGHAAV